MGDFDSVEQGISLKCPHCGSSLTFNPDSQLLECEVCGSKFNEDELKNKTITFKEQETFDEELKDYHCPSCGAEIMADENTTTEFCAYCGSPVVLRGRVNGMLKPNLIIPFAINKEKAKQILIDYLKNYLYVPKSFFEEANLNKVTGIYYPFWEADVDTNSNMTAEAKKVRTWMSGDRKYTETSYFNIYRSGEIHFEDISVNALKSADKKLIESVLPYPIESHKDFKMEYLTGFYAKKNDLTFDEVSEEIGNKISSYSNTVLLNTVSGYNGGVIIKDSHTSVKKQSHDYTLLPVWILDYKYKGKDYTFAVNGATGKAFGEIPISKAKLWFTFAGVTASIVAFLSLIGGLFL